MTWRRILGGIIVLIGLFGLVMSGMGLVYGRGAIDAAGVQADAGLRFVSESLDTVLTTLALANESVVEANQALDAVETAVTDTSLAISQMIPMMQQVTAVVSEDVPASLEAVQATIPDLVQVAKVMDDTLTTLNRFRIDETIPLINYRIQFDLGVDYNPVQPFDISVQQMGDSLEGLPQQLKEMDGYTAVTQDNLNQIADDLLAISGEMDDVNAQVSQLTPQLQAYIRLVSEANDKSRQARAALADQLARVKQILTLAMVWLGLTQIAPLYLGFELLQGKEEMNNE